MRLWQKNSRGLEIGFWFWIFLTYIFIFIPGVFAIEISEVNPLDYEFVEIYNPNRESLNLSEWKIKDLSTNNPDEITCHDIVGCNLITDAEYFLIIGRGVIIGDITQEEIVYFYVDDQKIGNGLNNDGDDIDFYKGNFLTSFLYDKSENGKTWQLCQDDWILNTKTPGEANLCEQQEEDEKEEGVEEEEDKYEKYAGDEEIRVIQSQENQNITIGEEIQEENEAVKIIYLGKTKIEEANIYKSKTRYIKEYGIYCFTLFCIIVIIFLLRKRGIE